jgi:hypothetical protein
MAAATDSETRQEQRGMCSFYPVRPIVTRLNLDSVTEPLRRLSQHLKNPHQPPKAPSHEG